MRYLVGLHGKKRSGKNSLGNYYQENHNARLVALADPIRKACAEIFNLNPYYFDGENPNREVIDPYWGLSPRQMLQLLGTEACRNVFGEDIWTKRAEMELLSLDEKGETNFAIITDIRFENEADWIRSKGGFIFHVIRPGNGEEVDIHYSEAGIKFINGDYLINNDSSIKNLYMQAYSCLYRVRETLQTREDLSNIGS